MKYKVTSAFVDSVSGQRYEPAPRGAAPTLFAPHDEDQRKRLTAAGCLDCEPTFDLATKPIEDLTRNELEEIALDSMRAELAKASDDDLRSGVERYRAHVAELAAEAAAKDLHGKKIDQLKEIATDEQIDLGAATKKADIIAKIEAGREAKTKAQDEAEA